MDKRKLVVWTCDVEDWAYAIRIETMRQSMPQYDHKALFFGSRMPIELQQRLLGNADIIICQGVKAIRVVNIKPLDIRNCSLNEAESRQYENVIVRVDSMRIDINGKYVDIFKADDPMVS